MEKSIIIVGAGQPDLISILEQFPQPDSKVHSSNFEIHGGGNAFNVSVGLSKLNVEVQFITQIGNDSYGSFMERLYKKHNIKTDFLIKKDIMTPFTYIIVDKKDNTRTCIHTPSEQLLPSDISFENIFEKIRQKNNFSLFYSDTHCEKDRGNGFEDLLKISNFIVANSKFSENYFKVKGILLACLTFLEKFENVEFLITTLGKKGSILFKRKKDELFLEKKEFEKIKYLEDNFPKKFKIFEYEENYLVYFCPSIEVNNISDTIGAGDCFISTICFCILNSLHQDVEKMLKMATWSASQSLKKFGATEGTPNFKQLSEKFKF